MSVTMTADRQRGRVALARRGEGGDESRDGREIEGGEERWEDREARWREKENESRRVGESRCRGKERERDEREREGEHEGTKKGAGHGSSGGKGERESGGSLDSPAIRGPRRALCWSTVLPATWCAALFRRAARSCVLLLRSVFLPLFLSVIYRSPSPCLYI